MEDIPQWRTDRSGGRSAFAGIQTVVCYQGPSK